MTTTTKKTTTRKKAAPRKEVELPANPFIHEVLELVVKQRSKAKKVEILKRYEDPLLRQSSFGTLILL